MKLWTQHRLALPFHFAVATALTISCSGCGNGPTESGMTSFTSSEAKADTAQLFTVPKEQLAHVEVVAAQKAPLPQTLRLSGAVAYDAFQTTPVFAAIGGPVHEILVAPGQVVHAGQALLPLPAPIIPQLVPPTSRRVTPMPWPRNFMFARRIFSLTAPLRKPIFSRRNPLARRRMRKWNPPPTHCGPWG